MLPIGRLERLVLDVTRDGLGFQDGLLVTRVPDAYGNTLEYTELHLPEQVRWPRAAPQSRTAAASTFRLEEDEGRVRLYSFLPLE